MAGMFGSENAALMAGGGAGQQFGGMDPLMLQEMMRNVPELRARQRKAQMLRGAQESMAQSGMSPGPMTNYEPTQQGGLGPTVAQYQTDYGALGRQAAGAIGGYLGNAPAGAAEGAMDEMQAQEVMRAMQQYGGGNTGGRMGGSGAGMDAVSAAPGAGTGPATSPQMAMTPGLSPGVQPGMIPGRQSAAMALRGNKTLQNLSQWFGQ